MTPKIRRKRSKKIRVGVIGVGFMGEHHARIYSSLKGAHLVGVSDIKEERAAEVAEKYKTKAFSDHKELLPNVDAVTIATPVASHFEIAMACIEKGVHCLIEKPMTGSPEEGKMLIEKAKERKVALAVGLIERFNPAFVSLIKLIKKRKPLLVEAKRFAPFNERGSDVSVVLDMMIHDIDLVFKIAGSPVQSFKGVGKKVKTGSLDSASVNIFFKNGLIANIEASRVSDTTERTINLNCEKINILTDLLNKKLVVKDLIKLETREIPVRPVDQLYAELRDFISSVAKRTAPTVTGEDGLAALSFAKEIEGSIC